MILQLLFPTLAFSMVTSEQGNGTEKLHGVLKNQTFAFFTESNSTMKTNITHRLNKDESITIEDELRKNQTSEFLSEDDEGFQDQERFPFKHCDSDKLMLFSREFCGKNFNEEMHGISTEDWCIWGNVVGPYDELTSCLELVAATCDCFYPNPDIQDFFLHIHSNYFHNCTEEEEHLHEDAPISLVVALTIIPVSFIPVLVCLVVWKNQKH